MAANDSSHNTPGLETASSTGPQPPALQETKDAVLSAADEDAIGQNAPGRVTSMGDEPSAK